MFSEIRIDGACDEDELGNLIGRESRKNVITVVVETLDANPHMSIRVPRSAFCGRLAIRVVAFAPTNRNGHAIGKCHRESTIDRVRDEIETRERIGDVAVLGHHACIIPKNGAVVKPSLYLRVHPRGQSHKRHTQDAEMVKSCLAYALHHIHYTLVQTLPLPSKPFRR